MASDLEKSIDDIEVVGSDEDVAIIGQDDVSTYNEDNILPEDPAIIDKIKSWLEPTAYDLGSGEYRKHLGSHAPGTGQWLSATENYQRWHNGTDEGLLWIKGIPGSGKSVMAASLVNDLMKEGRPVLYFFFRQIIDANHKPVNLLRDWLHQILDYSPPLQKVFKPYVHDPDRKGTKRALSSIGMDDLWKHLKTALVHMPRVYLVADALDEMDGGNDTFLQALAMLGSWRPAKVKVLITSRPVTAVETPLRKVPAIHVRLAESLVDVDIATYVQRGLDSSSIPEDDRVLVKEAVPGRANGLFLYAKLAMDAFLEPGAQVHHVLKTLPADLNEMYTDLLREHARRSGVPEESQLLILSWVTHATRPLRLLEMAEVIKRGSTIEHLKTAKDLVRAACGPLLEILPDETVSVVHHSLTEFLRGSTRIKVLSTPQTPFPVLAPGPTHEQLALACLKYLESGVLDGVQVTKTTGDGSGFACVRDRKNAEVSKRDKVLRLQFPFLEYAVKNWPVHAFKATEAAADYLLSKDLVTALDSFLTPSPRLDAWIDMVWRPSPTTGVTPLHIAARFGLTQYIKHIVPRPGTDLECCDSIGQTPLFHAAAHGQTGAVQALVDAGAKPNVDDNVHGLKPLHQAAKGNHAGVVAVLLSAGVDPLTKKTRENPGRRCGNAPRSVGHTALMYACERGHVEAVEAFLPFLNKEILHRCMYWASRSNKPKLVRRLIQHPDININAKVRGQTPLLNACGCRDVESIEALLGAGADVKILGSPEGDEFAGFGSGGYSLGYRTQAEWKNGWLAPLEAFCQIRHESTSHGGEEFAARMGHGIELLLQAGADINHRDPNSRTPLHHAARKPVLVRILLRAGADPNAEDSNGDTLLHTVQTSDDGWDLVKLLVEEGGADINKRRQTDGKTPLLLYLESVYTKNALRFVQELRPDFNVVDKEGNGPMHIVAKKSYFNGNMALPELMDLLVAAGAPLNRPNQHGDLPIHLAGHIQIVERLVKLGADVEARDVDGRTILMRSRGWSSSDDDNQAEDKVLKFIELGASVTTRDFKGRTVFHEVIRNKMSRGDPVSRKFFHFLASRGVDTASVDYSGNTLLHEAAGVSYSSYHRKEQVRSFRNLLDLGCDPDRVNYTGRTLLHVLAGRPADDGYGATNASTTVFDVALESCRNVVNVADRHGIQPIHLASSVSEEVMSRLLDAGADASCSTKEGLTPLHIAAWGRKTNIVGLLLDAISTGKYGDPSSIINASCVRGPFLTPLAFACLSGRPETVALLLKAGAKVKDFSSDLILACGSFEQENALWTRHNTHHNTHHRETKTEYGLLAMLGDTTRPNVGRHNSYHGSRVWLADEHSSTRLDEIVDMLVEHGISATGVERGFSTAWNTSASIDPEFEHTIICLKRLEEELGKKWRAYWQQKAAEKQHEASQKDALEPAPTAHPEEESGEESEEEDDDEDVNSTSATDPSISKAVRKDFFLRWTEIRLEAAQKAFEETHPFESVKADDRDKQGAILGQLLARRRYELAEAAFRHGLNPSIPDGNGNTPLHTLVKYGFANLLSKTIPLIRDHVRKLDSFEWRKEHAGSNSRGTMMPLVLSACGREIPNMEILRVLVEQAGADINASHLNYSYQSGGGYAHEIGDAPLHVLARGRHWWQVREALPYLLSRPAIDLEVRDNKGETPLHKALMAGQYRTGVFHKQAAKLLIKAGADVNAETESGSTCLSLAGGHLDLVSLLLEHGAKVTPAAVFSAIRDGEVEVLETILSSGVDPNTRRGSSPRTGEHVQGARRSKLNTRQRLLLRTSNTRLTERQWEDLLDEQEHPLSAAAALQPVTTGQLPQKELTNFHAKMVAKITLLLKRGADPFATFLIPDDDKLLEPYDNGVDNEVIERADTGRLGTSDGDYDAVDKRTRAATETTVLHYLISEASDSYNGRDQVAVSAVLDSLPSLNLEHKDSKGRTLLLAACTNAGLSFANKISMPRTCNRMNGYEGGEYTQVKPLIDILLERGADATARDQEGRNALHLAFRANKPVPDAPIHSILRAHPSALAQVSIPDQRTPLHYALVAAANGSLKEKQIRILLGDANCDPHVVDGEGNGALHFLAPSLDFRPDSRSLFAHFLSLGLNINTPNNKGETPLFRFLDIAYRTSPPSVSHWLRNKDDRQRREKQRAEEAEAAYNLFVNHGADFKTTDNRGRNLLHLVAERDPGPDEGERSWVELFKRLVDEQGLDPWAPDVKLMNSLDVAAACGNEKVLALFEKDRDGGVKGLKNLNKTVDIDEEEEEEEDEDW